MWAAGRLGQRALGGGPGPALQRLGAQLEESTSCFRRERPGPGTGPWDLHDRGQTRARGAPVWTAAILSDSDMDWHYFATRPAELCLHAYFLACARLGRDPPQSPPSDTRSSVSDHGVKSRSKYRRATQDGDGPGPECSISDLLGVTRVASQVLQGLWPNLARTNIDPGKLTGNPTRAPTHGTLQVWPGSTLKSRATPMKGQHGTDWDVTARYRSINRRGRLSKL
jgi:hypothetical protein